MSVDIIKAVCHEDIDFTALKNILIAGQNSYIGEAFKKYMSQFENYKIESFNTRSNEWKNMDFSKYDTVYDVAGIAHIKETKENRHLYYEVNKDLAVEIARKAKSEGVKQFIYLSSMAVYGLTVGRIDENTELTPINAYGKSKLEAEKALWKLKDGNFTVSIVRPPMVYGKGCKGNYQTLRKFALKFGFFPEYDNERSMIYINNLSSAVRGIIHNDESGLYFPQNLDYVRTYDMVKQIAEENVRSFRGTKIFNPFVHAATKKIGVFKKVFGNLTYSKETNVPNGWITVSNNIESIKLCEAGN
jgi:UDP-glucose 4-epimerase